MLENNFAANDCHLCTDPKAQSEGSTYQYDQGVLLVFTVVLPSYPRVLCGV